MIRKTDRKRFVEICKELDSLMKRIRKYNPEANLYAAGGGELYLMNGPSHNDNEFGCPALQENIVESESVESLDGGDW